MLNELLIEATTRNIPFTSVLFENAYSLDRDDLIALFKELLFTLPVELVPTYIENLREYQPDLFEE